MIDEDENRERQEAELEFCRCAYSPEEVWITSSPTTTATISSSDMNMNMYSKSTCTCSASATGDDCNGDGNGSDSHNSNSNSNYTHRIHRRLDLPLEEREGECEWEGGSAIKSKLIHVHVELVLSMPRTYPSLADNASILNIEASLLSSTSPSPPLRPSLSPSPSHSTTSSSSNKSISTSARTSKSKRASTDVSRKGRKIAMNAIPSLLQACRLTAAEHAGEEAVFVTLSRADEWVDTEWVQYLNLQHGNENEIENDEDVDADVDAITPTTTTATSRIGTTNAHAHTCTDETNKIVVLARKLIYSHHIIAKTKRKAIADLARHYKLGGYAKIGWPGIIIIEGVEKQCDAFIDDIRSMRWQHLVVRGEEHEAIAVPEAVPVLGKGDSMGMGGDDGDGDFVDERRKLPLRMVELGEDEKMSYLSSICRDAGLEDLFLTCMKIYNRNGIDNGDDDDNDGPGKGVGVGANADSGMDGNDHSHGHESLRYGSLVLVDHMNDKKGYMKWIQKACKSVGCSCEIIICHPNENGNADASSLSLKVKPKLKPIILVALFGSDETAIKQVLKRWRISRVDVDSRGHPCLERMMRVLVEVEACHSVDHDDDDASLSACVDKRTGSQPHKYPSQLSQSSANHRTRHDGEVMTMNEMESMLRNIGGDRWVAALYDAIKI